VKHLDPLALAFFGAASALLAGLLLYVIVFKTPDPATPDRAFDFSWARLRQRVAPKPAAQPSPAPPVAGSGLQAGHAWRYAVVVEPPAWRDITLTYRTQREGAGIGVLTEFVHAGGKSDFHLGTFAAGHASHANTRFPGFFLHASYFPPTLTEGQRFAWGWPWQPVREGRVKRYEAKLARWESIRVPAGVFTAAVIEADLLYIEGGKVQARARETLWYVPSLFQVVKVLREGRTPDEGSSRIVAELVEIR
jgi:hypothetical protein